MNRMLAALVAVFVAALVGCDVKPAPNRIRVDKDGASAKIDTGKKNISKPAPREKDKPTEVAQTKKTEKPDLPPLAPTQTFKAPDPRDAPPVTSPSGFFTSFPNAGENNPQTSGFGVTSVPGNYAGMSTSEALDKLLREISDGLAQRPTLVVWLIDNSKSAQDLVAQSVLRLKTFYQSEAKPGLTSVVATFAGEVKFLLETPEAEQQKVAIAFDVLPQDTTGKELTFAAVKQATENYAKLRTAKQDVVFVIITDEAGDDDNLVDEAIKTPKAKLIPIYVIGVPAPMGKIAGGSPTVEGGTNDEKPDAKWHALKQGPEGRMSDWVDFNTGGGGFGAASPMYDSNFGPFALERLCRATSGKFFIVRSGLSNWPVGAARFDPEIMRKYAPDYISENDWQDKLKNNRAKQALVKAAQLQAVNVSMNLPLMTFPIKGNNEAEMKRRLDEAQRGPAKIEAPINSFYEAMKDGEKDRDALDSPRWQAAFDCAMGRVLAAKARVEGYNEMLAALKRGKTAKNPSSVVWSLEPAEKTDAATQIASMSERARMYLQRCATEHKGTPWAMLAERDLQQQLGWKWEER